MSGQSGPGSWQASDGHWHPSQQSPQAHTPRPSSGTPKNPKSDGPKKAWRSFRKWITTTWGILTVIATLITLILGVPSVAALVKHFTSHKAPSALSPQGLTVNQVRAALLTSSDVSSIDKNVTSEDVALPMSSSCDRYTVNPTINVAREFKDDGSLILAEQIEMYTSSEGAHVALGEDVQRVKCSFASDYSVSDISSQLRGMCDESVAWATKDKPGGNAVSSYYGIIRCGRAIVNLAVATPERSSFDSEGSLVTGMELAIPKVQDLP